MDDENRALALAESLAQTPFSFQPEPNLPFGVAVDLNVFQYPGQQPAVMLTRIKVPEQIRGKGYGSQALKRLTDAADGLKVPIWLTINPYGPLDYEQLKAWYMRYGWTEHEEGVFVRWPK